MQIKGELRIELGKGERPDFHVNLDGKVEVCHEGWCMVFNGKPDYELFWSEYYRYNKYDFNKDFTNVKDHLLGVLGTKNPRKFAARHNINYSTILKFLETKKISYRALLSILRGLDYRLSIKMIDGQYFTGHPDVVFEQLNDHIRGGLIKNQLYGISMRTGIHYNNLINFYNGGKLSFERLAKIKNYSIKI